MVRFEVQLLTREPARLGRDVATAHGPQPARLREEQAESTTDFEDPAAWRQPGRELPYPAAEVCLVDRPVGEIVRVLCSSEILRGIELLDLRGVQLPREVDQA